MPYILSPIIYEENEELWQEGQPYKKDKIYDIDLKTSPPVNYDSHTIKPHSLSHVESPLHTQRDGKPIDFYFKKEHIHHFYGESLVVKITGNNFVTVPSLANTFHWEITLPELISNIERVGGKNYVLKKLILSLSDDFLPKNKNGTHNPNYVLTINQQCADYLISLKEFDAYVTSWKSTDFMPGKPERPIHNTLFKKAIIYECMNLVGVPEGRYFFVGIPLPFHGASESPCAPILFNFDEIK